MGIAVGLTTALPASAGVEECGDIRFDGLSDCEVRLSAQCTAGCSELGIYKTACATKLVPVCKTQCTLSATSTGLSGSPLSFTATSTTTLVSVTAVSPATLTSGTTATITGSGFSATAANNTVTIDGVAATVTAASGTSLTVTTPTLPCTPGHSGVVSVTVSGVTIPVIIDHFRAGQQTSRINYDSVEINRPIGDALFTRPANAKDVK
jgi:hypothetical protein